jgi:hypothetical protein
LPPRGLQEFIKVFLSLFLDDCDFLLGVAFLHGAYGYDLGEFSEVLFEGVLLLSLVVLGELIVSINSENFIQRIHSISRSFEEFLCFLIRE